MNEKKSHPHPEADKAGANDVPKQASYLPRVAKGATINFSGAILRMFLVYAYTLLLTRILSADGVGQYFLMITIINIVGTAALVGLDYGFVRYAAIFSGEGKYRELRNMIRFGVLLGVLTAVAAGIILFSLSGFLADILLDGSQAAVTGLRIFAIAIPFWVVARLFNAVTQGLHRMRYQVYSRDIAEQLAKIVLTIAAVALGMELTGVILANVLSLVLAAALSLIFALMVLPKAGGIIQGSRRTTGRLLKYSYPLAFSNILLMLVLWIDLLLVGYLGSPSDAGLYGVALKVATASAAILAAFATVFNPIISDVYNRLRETELQFLYRTVNRWIFTFSLPIFLLLVIFSGRIMSFFGAEYSTAATTLILLALSQLITACVGTAGLVLLMTGRSHIVLLNITTTLIVDVVLCFLLIPQYGIMGGAIANMSAAAVLNLIRIAEVWILLRIHAYDLSYLKPVLAGLISSALVLIARRYVIDDTALAQVAILATALLTLYAIIVVMFGLNKQDRDVLHLFRVRIMRIES